VNHFRARCPYSCSNEVVAAIEQTIKRKGDAMAVEKTIDDAKLVRRMQQGDQDAFAEFVDRYGGRVQRLVRGYIPNPSDAEDVTQEIFVAIFEDIRQLRIPSYVHTWVYRVSVNHCLRHCRRKAPDNLPFDDETLAQQNPSTVPNKNADPADTLERRELSRQLNDAIGTLSPLHSDVVVLCELHGLTYQECAIALEIPVGTVKSRMSTAFRRLRGLLTGVGIADIEPDDETEIRAEFEAPNRAEPVRNVTDRTESIKNAAVEATLPLTASVGGAVGAVENRLIDNKLVENKLVENKLVENKLVENKWKGITQ